MKKAHKAGRRFGVHQFLTSMTYNGGKWQMKKAHKAGRMSPYRRYNKREYIYSAEYQKWAAQFRPIKASQRRPA